MLNLEYLMIAEKWHGTVAADGRDKKTCPPRLSEKRIFFAVQGLLYFL
jgi:hypothetical protein